MFQLTNVKVVKLVKFCLTAKYEKKDAKGPASVLLLSL